MQKKRASLHDGPLADLFRPTDVLDRGAAHRRPRPTRRAPCRSRRRSRSAPSRGRAAQPRHRRAARRRSSPGRRVRRAYLAMIRVVGVGGAGVNAVNRMIEAGIRGVEFIAINTDAQQLALADASGHDRHRPAAHRRASARAPIPRSAAAPPRTSDDRIREALRGSDLVFVTAGEGGGTGTGAAPVVARIARELGALTVGIVTTPFRFEGARRREPRPSDGIRELSRSVDTLVTIPNDRLLTVLDQQHVDGRRLPRRRRPPAAGRAGHLRPDHDAGPDQPRLRRRAHDHERRRLGAHGHRHGQRPEPRVARLRARAVTSPLIGHEIHGATGILLAVSGGDSLALHDAMEIAEIVREAADDDANIIFGATVDERLGDEVWVTVIATGLRPRPHRQRGEPREPLARGGRRPVRGRREPALPAGRVGRLRAARLPALARSRRCSSLGA